MVVLVAIAVAAAGLLLAQALGFKPMAVLSGSMEPTYATGSIVFIDTNVDPESVTTGDTITYSLSGGDTVVTHRVIAIDQAKKIFTTKGDANQDADGPVPFASMVGRTLAFYIPYAGSILLTMGTTQGVAMALFVLAFIVVLLMVPVILEPSKANADKHNQPANKVQAAKLPAAKANKPAAKAQTAKAMASSAATGAHFKAAKQAKARPKTKGRTAAHVRLSKGEAR
jgi:signal peptidase